ncbi:MAG: polysaccharide biosynthesis/export family protein [Bacteroidota bacterium]
MLRIIRIGLFNLVLGSLVFSSCVPVKQLTYLQHAEDERKDSGSIRSYNLHREPYKLSAGDIISIRVASLTDEEFNFISKYSSDLGVIRSLNQYNQSINNASEGQRRGNAGFIGNGINFNQNPGAASIFISQQNTGFELNNSGEVSLPEIGSVSLEGLTISEAESRILEKLVGFYESPLVRIELINYDFTVLGEVESEGRYISFDPNLNMFDAIALAGNIGEFADRSNIKIIREQDGVASVLYLDLLDETVLNSENFHVQRGDIIIVPPLEARTAQRYTVPNASRTIGLIGGLLGVAAVIISLSQ